MPPVGATREAEEELGAGPLQLWLTLQCRAEQRRVARLLAEGPQRGVLARAECVCDAQVGRAKGDRGVCATATKERRVCIDANASPRGASPRVAWG